MCRVMGHSRSEKAFHTMRGLALAASILVVRLTDLLKEDTSVVFVFSQIIFFFFSSSVKYLLWCHLEMVMAVPSIYLQLHTVAKTAGMHHDEWVVNADRWVAGFLEKFEEGCHIMVSSSFSFSFF